MNTPLPIFPLPREISDLPGIYEFGASLTVRIAANTLSADTCELLAQMFSQHCQTACTLNFQPDARLPECSAVLGDAQPVCDELGEDTYMLRITPQGAALKGRTAQDLIHAFFTLMQCPYATCLKQGSEAFYMECGEIRDRPAIAHRTLHLCVFYQYPIILMEKAIRLAAYLKMNYIIFEFWGTYPFRALPELHWADRCHDPKEIQRLIKLARDLGMEIIPMFNHWGHASLSRGRVGKHVVLDQNPRHALLFEPEGWAWCLSNPDTHALLREVREELMELCGPGKFFHLGCDEASPFGACPLCRKKNFLELVPEYINSLADELEKKGRRVIVWGDQYLDRKDWPPTIYGTSSEAYPTREMLFKLNRKIIISDWQYRVKEPELPSSEYFLQQGFEVWPASFDDSAQNFEVMPQAADKIGAQGYIATTWHHLPVLMRRMTDICTSAWMGQRYVRRPEQGIMAQTLLRRAMPTAVAYDRAGFTPEETDPDGYGIIIP